MISQLLFNRFRVDLVASVVESWHFKLCDFTAVLNCSDCDLRLAIWASKTPILECSRPSLKFVKEFLSFSLSRPGHWEDSKTKDYEEWPRKSPMATDSD